MVDLTADTETEEEEMNDAQVTPSPNVSDGSEMETDKENDILAYHGLDRGGADSSDEEDWFQHV